MAPNAKPVKNSKSFILSIFNHNRLNQRLFFCFWYSEIHKNAFKLQTNNTNMRFCFIKQL